MAVKVPTGHHFTLKQLQDLQVMACDIMCILPYPINEVQPPYMDPDYDSNQRIVYFVPGEESKYVEVSEPTSE